MNGLFYSMQILWTWKKLKAKNYKSKKFKSEKFSDLKIFFNLILFDTAVSTSNTLTETDTIWYSSLKEYQSGWVWLILSSILLILFLILLEPRDSVFGVFWYSLSLFESLLILDHFNPGLPVTFQINIKNQFT